jgi:hypothetical protein
MTCCLDEFNVDAETKQVLDLALEMTRAALFPRIGRIYRQGRAGVTVSPGCILRLQQGAVVEKFCEC